MGSHRVPTEDGFREYTYLNHRPPLPAPVSVKRQADSNSMAGSGSRRSARARLKPPSADAASSDPDLLQPKKPLPPSRRSSDHGPIRLMNIDLKALLGFGILTFLLIAFVLYGHLGHTEGSERDSKMLRVVMPLPAPKMMDLPQFQGEHKESLYWGTYRPLVYLGIRARTPKSLIAGLMWIGMKNGQYFMRHVCQDSDELSTYGWTHHNGRDYGHQILVDQELTLTTSFLKANMNGSGYGGDWAVRIGAKTEK
ncbi:hypothetical protein ACLOJK_039832 [Asimina triloba]